MCGSPWVNNTKNSKMLNVCVCGRIIVVFFLFIVEYWLELHTWKLCVLLTIPMLHRLERTGEHDTRCWIFVVFCGNLLLCSVAIFTDCWLWALSLSLCYGYTGLLNTRRWIFVLFCGNPLFFIVQVSKWKSGRGEDLYLRWCWGCLWCKRPIWKISYTFFLSLRFFK